MLVIMSPTMTALVGSGFVFGVWFLVVVVIGIVTRPYALQPGTPTLDLGPEPPAVANLLVTRCRLGADAADATLLDLAARRVLELHQGGSDPADLLVRVREPAPVGLAPFEQRVFDRVAATAGDRLVPLTQVLDAYADGGPNWLLHLRAEVIEEAKKRGLVRTRPLSAVILASLLAGMLLACFGIVPLNRTGTSAADNAFNAVTAVGWFCGTIFLALVLIFVAVLSLKGESYTKAGRQAGRNWLGVAVALAGYDANADLPPAAVAVWDRYLAYGVALGVNPLAARTLDLRAGRVVALVSRRTGRPRTVVVRYPRNPLAYVQAGVRIGTSIVLLIILAALWAVATRDLPEATTYVRWGAYLVLAALTARTVYGLLRAIYAKLSPVTVEGLVVAAHLWRPQVEGGFPWIQIVVDNGRRDRLRPWLVRGDRAATVRRGDVVRLRAQPVTRFVLELEVTKAFTPAPAIPPTAAGRD
jgi:hypothetical protein